MRICCCFQMHHFVDACGEELRSCCVFRNRHLIFLFVLCDVGCFFVTQSHSIKVSRWSAVVHDLFPQFLRHHHQTSGVVQVLSTAAGTSPKWVLFCVDFLCFILGTAPWSPAWLREARRARNTAERKTFRRGTHSGSQFQLLSGHHGSNVSHTEQWKCNK